MSYRIAAIDVHKRMLAVVTADVSGTGEYQFDRHKFASTPDQLQRLAEWLVQQEVEEIVMESTAQYWKPVWATLERYWKPARQQSPAASKMSGTLHLCQAQSNRAPKGRKNDYADAERMLKRLLSQELRLSFVPDPEQRLWRTVTRRKLQLTRHRVRLGQQLESLLEQAHIKLSSFVSDLLGLSAVRMCQALADGVTDPAAIAALADARLRATPEQLKDALGACLQLSPVYRRLIQMALQELKLIDGQIEQLEHEAASLMQAHQDAIQRLAEVPGLGPDSALQLIAEVGATAAAFDSPKQLASWVGVCPGDEESAGQSKSTRSPKGNKQVRRILDQAAHAAVKTKGSIFEITFRRLLSRMNYQSAIWAIAHRLCRLIWLILHKGVSYQERGEEVSAKSKQTRTTRMIRELKKLGYRVEKAPLAAGVTV